jgi:transcription-repair coupling factor (superfamily II helicase)
MLGRVAEGIAVEGMESLTPALVDGMELLVDVLPEGTHVVVCDPERVRSRAHDLVATSQEFLEASWASAAAGSAVPVDLEPVLGTASYRTLADVREHAIRAAVPWWSLSPFAVDVEARESNGDGNGAAVLAPDAHDVTAYRGDPKAPLADVQAWLHDGWRVAVVTEGAGLARRVVEVLGEADLAARLAPDLSAAPDPAVATVTTGGLGRGFVAPGVRLAVVTESDLTGGSAAGSTRDMRRMPARRRNVVDPLQLSPGDLVVHEQHGVGRFVEMIQRTIQGATREYVVIEYAPSKRGQPGDRLFVPSDSLDQVTKYVGGEQPSLNKLGGSDWAKTKGRARKAVKADRGRADPLYSRGWRPPGTRSRPDTPWQRSSRTRSPTSRRRTSWSRSKRSRPTWRSRSRWTG